MVSYQEFAQRVRRHRPSEVLAACGAVSAVIPLGESDDRGAPPALPSFALAGVARAALLHGNERRHRRVTPAEFWEMVSMFLNVEDPLVKDGNRRSFLVRVGAEQFPYQALPFRDIARTRALFVDAAEATDQCIITQHMWFDLLDCTLEEFVGVAMLLHTSATKNSGRFDPRWLDQANFEPVFRILSRGVIECVVRKSFLLSRERFREIARSHQIEDPGLKRYSFNPILVGPFVEVGESVPVAPVARAILFRATPGSLYYTAAERHGQVFTNALGRVFESYVRRQLETCEPELLLHDLEYDAGKRAVDFIVVLPGAVLLIEAKVTPLTQGSRLGGKRLDSDYARAPGRGMDQIENTARLIRERDLAFGDIPADRPCLGLVVTLEPYYGCTNQIVMPAQGGRSPSGLRTSASLSSWSRSGESASMRPSSISLRMPQTVVVWSPRSGATGRGGIVSWTRPGRVTRFATRELPDAPTRQSPSRSARLAHPDHVLGAPGPRPLRVCRRLWEPAWEWVPGMARWVIEPAVRVPTFTGTTRATPCRGETWRRRFRSPPGRCLARVAAPQHGACTAPGGPLRASDSAPSMAVQAL